MKKFLFISFLFLCLFSQITKAQGYDIKFKISGLKDTTAYLGHYYGAEKNTIVDDTIRFDKNGNGVAKDKKQLPGGLYFLYFQRKVFMFIIDKEQVFSAETDTGNFIKNMKLKGSQENELFYSHLKYLDGKMLLRDELQKQYKNVKEGSDSAKQYQEKLVALNDEVKKHFDEVIDNNKGTFFSSYFSLTSREMIIPDGIADDKKFDYFRYHYVDYFNFADTRLVRTPLYNEKLTQFLDIIVRQPIDSITKDLDRVIKLSRANDELFKFVLTTIYNYFAGNNLMGMDAVFVHLAEKYYIPEAKWSDAKFIADLKEKVNKRKPLLIGKVMPDVKLIRNENEHFTEAHSDTAKLKNFVNGTWGDYFSVNSVGAKYTILVFWEADCSHCKEVMPVFKKLYGVLRDKGVEIIAVHMLTNQKKWVDFLVKHEMLEWINAWNPFDYTYKAKYDIQSSPVVYLVDKQKKIIAKRIGPEECEEIIIQMLYEEAVKDKKDAAKIDASKKFIDGFASSNDGLEAVKKTMERALQDKEKEEILKYIEGKIKK